MQFATGVVRFLRRVWKDEAGFVISAELVLVGSLVVIGLVVGLTSLRNQVVQELADVGQAIGSVNQSYAYPGIMKPCMAWTGGSFYLDKIDFCQDGGKQVPGNEPGGLMLRLWPNGAPTMPTGGEWDGREACGCCKEEPAASVSAASPWVGYPACYVRADVRMEADALGRLDPKAKAALVNYQLVVFIDADRYEAFQARLVEHLGTTALRRGQWSPAITERKGRVSVEQGCLPPGCQYEAVIDVKPGSCFQPGDWGTDLADLGRETIVLVNTARDHRNGQIRWSWFHMRRPEHSVRSGLEVKVEFLGADGRVVGQDVVPVCVGYNWSPPGLEVFDVFNRRESDFRTLVALAGKRQEAVAAVMAARQRDPQRRAEDLLVVVSPYLALPNAGNPPCSFATRLVIPLTKKFTAEEVGRLKEIRATVLGCECAGMN
jgi:hypothetical protein